MAEGRRLHETSMTCILALASWTYHHSPHEKIVYSKGSQTFLNQGPAVWHKINRGPPHIFMFPKMYLMLRLFLIVWYPCRLSLCEQTNEIKRNLWDKNSNKNVQSKNKTKKMKNILHMYWVIFLYQWQQLYWLMRLFKSLHMNTITIKIKKLNIYLFGKRHENPEVSSPFFSSISNVFCSVLMGRMGRMGLSLSAQLLYSWRDGREAYS